MEEYPKTAKIKNGKELLLRPYVKDDFNAIVEFFQSLPLEDRLYLRIDVMKTENLFKRFGNIDYNTRFPLLAFSGKKLVAVGALNRAEFGWMRNLGEIRIVVSPEFQRKGLCTILTRELFLYALKTDLFKIQAAIMDNQDSAKAAFQRMGFKPEAVLKKHVTDLQGNRKDLILLNLDIQDLWDTMDEFIQDKFYIT